MFMTKEVPLKLKAAILLGAIGGTLAACNNQDKVPQIGEKVIISNTVTGIDDYNQINKTYCTLEEGSEAKIEEISYLKLPAERTECFEDEVTGRKECYPVPNNPTVVRINNGTCNTWVTLEDLEKSIDSLDDQE